MSQVSIREITREACAAAGQPIAEVMGKSRKAALCRVRERIWLQAYEAGYSSVRIGRVFDRDHTSILHGIRNARPPSEGGVAFQPGHVSETGLLDQTARQALGTPQSGPNPNGSHEDHVRADERLQVTSAPHKTGRALSDDTPVLAETLRSRPATRSQTNPSAE